MARSVRLQDQRMALAYQLHATLLNSIGALVAQAQICERAIAVGGAQSLNEIARLRSMLKDLEGSAREIIDSAFHHQSSDLSDALREELVEFQRRHPGIEIESSFEGGLGAKTRWLTRLIADTVHEALTNAARHGKPSRVEVSTTLTENGLLLRIRDNGQGFDARQLKGMHVNNVPGRYGIRIMQESAKSVQGRLEISSVPGRGTQVTLFVPQIERARRPGKMLPDAADPLVAEKY